MWVGLCLPFSLQSPFLASVSLHVNSHLHATRWQDHCMAPVLRNTVKSIALLQPRAGWLENVEQMGHTDSSGISPLEWATNEISSLGYAAGYFSLDLGLFLPSHTRKRLRLEESFSNRQTYQQLSSWASSWGTKDVTLKNYMSALGSLCWNAPQALHCIPA